MYGQQDKPYKTPAGSAEHTSKVEQYLPNIIDKWKEKAKSTSLGNKLYNKRQPLVAQPEIQVPNNEIPDDALGLDIGSTELAVAKERKAFILETQMEEFKHKRKLEDELGTAYRVIGLQNGVLKLLYDDPLGKEVLLGILNKANISEDELVMLAKAVPENYKLRSEKH